MRRAYSLRTRLIMAAAIWVTLGCLTSFLVMSLIFRQQTKLEYKDEVLVHVEELFRLTQIGENGELSLASRFSDPRYDQPKSGFYWQATVGQGLPLRSASLGDAQIDWPVHSHPPEQPVELHVAMGPTGPIMFAEKAIGSGTPDNPVVQFLVATDLRHIDAVVAGFDRRAAGALALFAVSLIVSAAILVWYALSPLKRLRTSLSEVKTGNKPFLEDRFPSEVQPVVTELNDLIDSMGNLLLRARTQAGNLAHGLKGPLTIIADEAHELTEGRLSAESSAAILEQTRLMQRHIDHHVARARAVAGVKKPGLKSSVPIIVDEIADAVSRLYPQALIDTSEASNVDLTVAVDRMDMYEIVGNVMDNACKFGGGRVTVTAREVDESFVEIAIDDDGPGLPAEAWEEVLAIGVRWDERTPGSGLGLAIVDELAVLYGGTVTLGQSDLGGLRVTVKLPKGH
jgi:signal transduction histidine kinase